MVASSRLVAYVKESIVGRLGSEEDPMSFVLEVGAPLLEEHVGTLDGGAVGSCMAAISAALTEEGCRGAALELAQRLIAGARREACGEVSGEALRSVMEEPSDERCEASWAAAVRAVCLRWVEGAWSAACAEEVAAVAARLSDHLETRLDTWRRLELYAETARCRNPVAARRALDRVQDILVAAATSNPERRARQAAIDALARLWRNARRGRGRDAAARFCAELVAGLEEDQDEVALVRRIEGLVGLATAAIAAAAADEGIVLSGVTSALTALDAACRAWSASTKLAAVVAWPTLKRARAALLEATLVALSPSVARTKASFLARSAVAAAKDGEFRALRLAARALGAGCGLEEAANLVDSATAALLPFRGTSGKRPRVDAPPDDAVGCVDALAALVAAAALAPEARTRLDALAAQVCDLVARKPTDETAGFWRDSRLRAAALRLVQAALAAPRPDGHRTVALVSKAARAAKLEDADDAVANALAQLNCLADLVLRPRAPPLRIPVFDAEPRPESTRVQMTAPPATTRAQAPVVEEEDDGERCAGRPAPAPCLFEPSASTLAPATVLEGDRASTPAPAVLLGDLALAAQAPAPCVEGEHVESSSTTARASAPDREDDGTSGEDDDQLPPPPAPAPAFTVEGEMADDGLEFPEIIL